VPTAAMRLDVLPDLPTVNDFVPGYETSSWFGIGAPRDTPTDIVERLNKEVSAGLANRKLKDRIFDLGGSPLVLSPAEFRKFIADETKKWAQVVKFSGAKLD